MSDNLVKRICDAWIKDGLANECFWEGWPQCPTPDDSLTPKMVLDRIKTLQAALARAEAERDEVRDVLRCGEFLLDRLRGLEWIEGEYENTARDFFGHVDPAFHRFESAIRQLKGQQHD